MMDINVGDFKINQIVLLSPQLLTDAILGLDFLVEYQAVIDFEEHSVTLTIIGECTKIKFIGIKKSTDELGCVGESSEDLFRNFGLVSVFPRKLQYPTADRGQHLTDPIVTASGVVLVDEKEEAIGSKKYQQQRVKDEVNLSIPRREVDREGYVEVVSEYDSECRNSQRKELSTLAKVKEDHIVDNCSATEHTINEECGEITKYSASRGALCLTTTYSGTNVIGDHVKQKGLDTRERVTDDRMVTAEQLRGKVSENNNLSTQQRE
jgi:hypothetical protein